MNEPPLPFRATTASTAYDGVRRLPVSVLLDSVRSLYNVGAFFRTLEAAGGAHLRGGSLGTIAVWSTSATI